jgi:hypothetical protein
VAHTTVVCLKIALSFLYYVVTSVESGSIFVSVCVVLTNAGYNPPYWQSRQGTLGTHSEDEAVQDKRGKKGHAG